MPPYYFDTSGLVKRYVAEIGTVKKGVRNRYYGLPYS